MDQVKLLDRVVFDYSLPVQRVHHDELVGIALISRIEYKYDLVEVVLVGHSCSFLSSIIGLIPLRQELSSEYNQLVSDSFLHIFTVFNC